MLRQTTIKEWIDVSVSLGAALPVWPGDEGVTLRAIHTIGRKHSSNLSGVSMGLHSGTHIDAPLHFLKRGKSVDALGLGPLIGECRVIDTGNVRSIEAEDVSDLDLRPGDRILFKTRNSRRRWYRRPFNEHFAYLSRECAELLAHRDVALVGIDYLSIGSRQDGRRTHLALLEKNIVIIEGLDLSRVQQGGYFLVCLPLKVAGTEGAPARVIVGKFVSGEAGEHD